MIGFDKTITIYNKHYDPAKRATTWPHTVISNASWHGKQQVSAGEGLNSNDGYSVRIMANRMPPGYIDLKSYQLSPKGHWTAQNGDVVVLGEGIPCEGGNITAITSMYTECFAVTAVHTSNLLQPGLKHLRVEGK